MLLVVNRGDLAGAADALYIQLLPWVVLAVFVLGHGAGARPAGQGTGTATSQIGQFDLTEAEGVAA